MRQHLEQRIARWRIGICALGLCLCASSWAANIYRSENADGTIRYSSQSLDPTYRLYLEGERELAAPSAPTGRLCARTPAGLDALIEGGAQQYAIEAALTGDRSHQREFVRELSMRAALTTSRLNGVPGLTCVAPHAAFYAMPRVALPPGKTDEDYGLALLRKTGILCVYGSGFGLPASGGFFRVVFLAQPDVLSAIYDDIATFTADFLA